MTENVVRPIHFYFRMPLITHLHVQNNTHFNSNYSQISNILFFLFWLSCNTSNYIVIVTHEKRLCVGEGDMIVCFLTRHNKLNVNSLNNIVMTIFCHFYIQKQSIFFFNLNFVWVCLFVFVPNPNLSYKIKNVVKEAFKYI